MVNIEVYIFKFIQEIIKKKYNKISNIIDMNEYRERYCESFGIKKYFNLYRKNFYRDFLELIRNLDIKSIKTVITILYRILCLNICEKLTVIYNKKEMETILDIMQNYEKEIEKLSDGNYCYKEMILPIKHFEVSVFYHKHCIELIKNKSLIKSKNIIDVGGFIGESAIVFSNYTNKKIYTFEPVSQNYNLMLKTIELNNKDNIIPINLALSDKKETININLSDSSSSMINTNTDKYESINTTTLDEWISDNPMEIGLIKVDIEGAEPKFIKGALEIIKKQRPILIISIYHNSDDFFLIKPYIESLNLNYKFSIIKPIDAQILFETVLLCEPK